MPHIILLNLQLELFFIYFIVKSFKKVLIYCLTMGSIIVYCTTIILNILNKVADCMELRVVEDWLRQLGVNKLVLLKYYFCFF